MKRIDKQTFFQFIRFAIVGILNTAVSLITIYILMHLFSVEYKLSNLIGYILGVINSFFWSKLWVFKKNNSNILKEAVYFILIFAVCYGIQFTALVLFVEKLHIHPDIAQFLGMCVYTLFNFMLNRCITFKPAKQHL